MSDTRVQEDIRKVFALDFAMFGNEYWRHRIGTLATLFVAAHRQQGGAGYDLSWLMNQELAAHSYRNVSIEDLELLYDRVSDEVSGILEWLKDLNLSTPEGRRCASDAFEDALRVAVARWGKELGKFITPAPVARLMLDLADIGSGMSIYDPCFGVGELLVGAARRLRETTGPIVVPQFVISGFETSRLAHRVAECRLVLAGFDGINLRHDDALKVRGGAGTGFDRILASPPWGSDAEDRFLQHAMANLRPEGRAVILLPERTLIGPESMERRKELLSDYRVDGVVALPAGALDPFTRLASRLVVFSRADPSESVPFVTVGPAAWKALPEGALDGDDGPTEGAQFAGGEWLPNSSILEIIGAESGIPGGRAATGAKVSSVPRPVLVQGDHELVAKDTGSAALDAQINQLVTVDRTVEVKQLAEVATVHTSPVSRTGEGEVLGTVLLPTDVADNRLDPSADLTDEDRARITGDDYLRVGDVVVPLSDTIGNIRLVNDSDTFVGYDGVVAGPDIAVVRVQDGLRPQYLAALLRSPAYGFWLTGHADGSPRRLSIDVLKTLQVPVPPVSMQDDVVKEVSNLRADVLALLYRLIAGTAQHPVTRWLEGPFARYLATGRLRDKPSGRDAIATFSLDIRLLGQSAGSADDDRSIGGRWLKPAWRAAAALDDFGSVPAGTGRLVILEHAAAKLREAIGTLDRTNETIGVRLRSVTWALIGFVEEEIHALQRKGSLEIAAVPPEVQAGTADEVRLQVINSSPVPLRNVRVTARQADRTVVREEVSYLAEGHRHEFPVVVRAQDDTKPWQIDVAWRARRLDATQVRGEKQVSVLVRSSDDDAADAGDLGASPYIVGNPVDRDEMFFGRDGIMDRIRRHLGGDRANVILLEGNRRTGKTSILKQLGKEDALPGWIPVYCSFQDLDSMATPNVFRLLAKQTGWALADAGIETWIPDLPEPAAGRPFKLAFLSEVRAAFSDDHPYETLALYLSAAVEAVQPRRILLMLDEFDKLQEGIDGGITSSQVPENIRHLLQHQPGLGAIITGSRRLKRLREEYWSALFGFGHRIGVSALPEAEARRLVTEPVAPRIRYLPQARDRLVTLCARHPFLIQSLCSRVFDLAAAGSERTITSDVVERAATEMVRDNEHFQTLWGYAGSERRRLILALSHRLADSADAVNLDLISMKIAEQGVPVRDDKALADDLTELRELELLEIDETYRGGTYRLSIPLMRKWLRLNVDFADLVKRARREARRDG